MRSVLLTGGAGFIGSNLVRLLLRERVENIVVLDNLTSGYRRNLDGLPVRVVEGDVRNRDAVEEAIRGCDTVFHLAASVGNARSIANPIEDALVNVLGTLTVTQALLPALVASGDGVLINMGSTAGRAAHEGGGGYTAAKHGVAVMTETLRLELVGKPVRITEIAPGMVKTEEFGLVRFGGDEAKRDAVYAGIPDPLAAEDIADAVVWVATRPSHVNIDLMVVRPRAQAAQHKVHRQS